MMIKCLYKFILKLGVEESIVNVLILHIQGGPSLTYHFCDYAGSNYLKNLTFGYEETHIWSYKPAPLFYLLSIGFRVRRRLSEINQNSNFFFGNL
jgi:hypothetical protein